MQPPSHSTCSKARVNLFGVTIARLRAEAASSRDRAIRSENKRLEGRLGVFGVGRAVLEKLACQPWLAPASEGWSQLSDLNRRPTVYKSVKTTSRLRHKYAQTMHKKRV